MGPSLAWSRTCLKVVGMQGANGGWLSFIPTLLFLHAAEFCDLRDVAHVLQAYSLMAFDMKAQWTVEYPHGPSMFLHTLVHLALSPDCPLALVHPGSFCRAMSSCSRGPSFIQLAMKMHPTCVSPALLFTAV